MCFGSREKLECYLNEEVDEDILDLTPVEKAETDEEKVPWLIKDVAEWMKGGQTIVLRERLRQFKVFKDMQSAMPKQENYLALLDYKEIKASSSKDIYLQINEKVYGLLQIVNHISGNKYIYEPFNTKSDHEFFKPKINIPSNRADMALYCALLYVPMKMVFKYRK